MNPAATTDSPTAETSPKVYGIEAEDDPTTWREFIAAMRSGNTVEITHEIWERFLNILPPVYEHETFNVGGRPRRVDFCSAEGYDTVTAFWRERGEGGVRYFCQHMHDVWNPNA